MTLHINDWKFEIIQIFSNGFLAIQWQWKKREPDFWKKIDFDEENTVAVFRVPAHNNVNGADFYHDFNLVSFLHPFVRYERHGELSCIRRRSSERKVSLDGWLNSLNLRSFDV